MAVFPTLFYTSTRKIPTLFSPALISYPFRAEHPRKAHYMKYPRGEGGALFTYRKKTFVLLQWLTACAAIISAGIK